MRRPSPAHRVVLGYAACDVAGYTLGFAVAGHASPVVVALDLVLDVFLVGGLWLLWRPVWLTALVLAIPGESLLLLRASLSPVRAVVLILGAIQIGLLLVPALRRELRNPRLPRFVRPRY